MSKRFQGRTVLITGAAGGLGRTSALAFAREGASLVLTDVNEQGLAESAREIRAQGSACAIHVLDLAIESDIEAFGASICRAHAEIHVLYNNAGLHLGESTQQVNTVSQQKWLYYLSVNSIVPVLLAQALRPSLARAKGVILNQSSMASFVPATIYGVTKATLNALTFGMAHAFASDGIRVVAIAPGMMATGATKSHMTPQTYERIQSTQLLKLDGTADDIANLALFLASDDARFITCEIVSCDAGSSIRGWRA